MKPSVAAPKSRARQRPVNSVRQSAANTATFAPLINSVQCGDCVAVLKTLPNDCIDTVITSPPYFQQRNYAGIGMGNEADANGYLSALAQAFAEVVRVLKPHGSIVYNIGDKYINSSLMLMPYRFAIMATAQFPVKLVNNITWVKRNPTPRQFTRRLVSATEPFFHFVKTPQYYYHRDGFMAANKNGQSAPAAQIAAPLFGAPSPQKGARYRQLIQRSELTERQKAHALEALEGVLQEIKDGKIKEFRIKIRGIHAPAFGGQDGGRKTQMERQGFTVIRIYGAPMKRDVIETAVESRNSGKHGGKHSAVYPLLIVRELLHLLCPPQGIVLDPYMGSGTTLVAAKQENRPYLGIDINKSYCQNAREWLENV